MSWFIRNQRAVFYFSEEKSLVNLVPYVCCSEFYVPKFFRVDYPIVFYEISSTKFRRFLKRMLYDRGVYLCGSGGLYLYQKFPEVFRNSVVYVPITRKRNSSGKTLCFVNRFTGKEYLGECVVLQEGNCNEFVLLDDVCCSGSTVNFLRKYFDFDAVVSVLSFSKDTDSYLYIKENDACSYLLWDILKTGGVYG